MRKAFPARLWSCDARYRRTAPMNTPPSACAGQPGCQRFPPPCPGAAQRPGRPTRHRRGLRFWKAAHDTPAGHVSRRGATSVIPFPGAMISGASPCLRLDESGAPRTSTARFPRLNPGRTESARPWYRNRSVSISRTARVLLLVLLTVLPMIALQAWHERELRDERGDVIRERVVYRVHQLATEIGELRE